MAKIYILNIDSDKVETIYSDDLEYLKLLMKEEIEKILYKDDSYYKRFTENYGTISIYGGESKYTLNDFKYYQQHPEIDDSEINEEKCKIYRNCIDSFTI